MRLKHLSLVLGIVLLMVGVVQAQNPTVVTAGAGLTNANGNKVGPVTVGIYTNGASVSQSCLFTNVAPYITWGTLAGGGSPTGAAGGDLGSTYPNPTVVSVANVTTGKLPVANGGTATNSVAGVQSVFSITPTTRTLTAGTGLSGGGDLSADRTFNLANTAVTAGTYGDSTHTITQTVDAQGRITSISTNLISGGVTLSGWIKAFGPSDMMGVSAGSSASNDVSIIDVVDTSSSSYIPYRGFTTGATNAPQTKYAYFLWDIKGDESAWGSGTNFCVGVKTSSTVVSSNCVNLTFFIPGAAAVSSNNLVSTTANTVNYYQFPASFFPTFAHGGVTNIAVVRAEFVLQGSGVVNGTNLLGVAMYKPQ